MIKNQRLQLVIPLDSYRQMVSYVELAKGEITWFFDVEWDKILQIFRAGKVYLLPQEASGALVEMEEKDVSDFLLKLMDEGVEQLPRGWGHSHVNMGAFFSTTDDKTINELDTGTFLVALVMNKRQEYEATVRFNYNDFTYRQDLEMVVDNFWDEIPEEYKKEVEEKVKEFTPVPWTNYSKKKNWNGGKKGGHKQHLLTTVDDIDALDFLDDDGRLDPAIQEQFRQQAKDRRGSQRLHEMSDDQFIHSLDNERICSKCFILEQDHLRSAYSCDNPNYVPFEDAYEKMEKESGKKVAKA